MPLLLLYGEKDWTMSHEMLINSPKYCDNCLLFACENGDHRLQLSQAE